MKHGKCKRLCSFLLLVLLVVQLASMGMNPSATYAQTQSASAVSQSPDPTGQKIRIDAQDTSTQATLRQQGATMLVDYDSFQLWQLPNEQDEQMDLAALAPQAQIQDDIDTIYLRGTSITPTREAVQVAASLQQVRQQEPQLWMVQFIGPVKDAWLDEVQQTGCELVAYMPNHAYIVWGDGEALERLEELQTSTTFVQWSGAYHPAYRLEPSLQASTQPQSNADGMLDVTVQFYATEQVEDALARLKALGGTLYQPPMPVLNLVNISLQLPADQLETIATWPAVYNIEPWHAPELLDEAQGQIVAGNINESGDNVVPSGPGYLDWLTDKGFPTAPESYPVVDIVDSGLDNGQDDAIQHPDFYQYGDTANPDRVFAINDCTGGGKGNDVDGHGTINAGIVGGYNDQISFPYEDARGYQLGLGISPYGRVAATKVFNNSGYFDSSACDDTMEGIVDTSFNAGAAITSNSWGRSYSGYGADAQAYDALTRDALATTDGNQQMLHIFSAGNNGPNAGSIGSPATAKNVLAVGATENVRDDGVEDGCSATESDNANDIAGFSSRGPTADGRNKPDIVAPGVHIQGPASQDPYFDGESVCGGVDSPYYPDDQRLYTWSSGTSHSAPALAGAASLIYEYYGRVLKPGETPTPAMVKALLLNSTRYLKGHDSDENLPSNAQGWGGVNLGNVFADTPRRLVDQEIVFESTGQEHLIEGTVFDTSAPLRVSLVWTDAPGSTTGKARVNDLDLEVIAGSWTYRGNVFDGAFSTPGGLFDVDNNIEQVFVPAGTGDSFTVRVIASDIAGDGVPGNNDLTDQDFALVIANDIAGTMAGGNVQGTITDAATGEPLTHAQIQAQPATAESSPIKTISRADGSFSLMLNQGDWTFEVSAYGYESRTIQNVQVGEEPSPLEVTLDATARRNIEGYITDKRDGIPLYARIEVQAKGYQTTAFTDPTDGSYTLSLDPDEAHTFTVKGISPCSSEVACEASATPYGTVERAITPNREGTRHNFALEVNTQLCNAPGYTIPSIYFEDFEADNGGYKTTWCFSLGRGTPPREQYHA